MPFPAHFRPTAFVLVLAFALTATSLAAQEQGWMLSGDLNQDGIVERFSLQEGGDMAVDLVIENLGGGVIFADDIAWSGGMGGQQPYLQWSDAGSLQVVSLNEGIGRDRWHLTLTIAYRRDTFVIAGVTFDWYDTLDSAAGGVCDFNLLTGRGLIERFGAPAEEIAAPWAAMPVTDWTLDSFEARRPDACS